MKEILDPIAMIPGVRLAAVISVDGVPIATVRGTGNRNADEEQIEEQTDAEFDGLTALAAGYIGEVGRSLAQLSWNPPRRIVLNGTNGAIVMQEGPGAILLVILEQGTTAQELRVPMESACARMQRHLRGIGKKDSEDRKPRGVTTPWIQPQTSAAGSDGFGDNPISDTSGQN